MTTPSPEPSERKTEAATAEISTAPRYARAADAIGAPVGEAMMVLNAGTGDVYQMNSAGAFVWRALESPSTLDDLRARASAHFAGADAAGPEIDAFVRELLARGLLVVSTQA